MEELSKSAQNSQPANNGLTPKKAIFNFTPGPWHADENEIDAASGEMLGCAYAFYVGDPRPENLEHTPETYANARLMASAPTLLTALEYVLDSLPAGQYLEVRAVADAAIRTARGE